MCGTQRCDLNDPVWREGCKHYQDNKPLIVVENNDDNRYNIM